MKKVVMFLLAMAGMGAVASAAYIDASGSNTVLAADGSSTLTNWTLRTSYANSGTIYQSPTVSGDESGALIKTIVTGLVSGQAYDVSVNYWNAGGQFWCVSAGLSENDMKYFADNATSSASNLSVSTKTGLTESDRYELAGYIGEAIANANGEIVVFIDDTKPTGHQTYNHRAWYDGVTVTAVPEPVTMSMLGLGGLFLGRRRK
ncbi:MAG: PEP-CTERM sorting domain-containing protein [Sedimentisphaerales bacterium]|nr:PEP-CTERM sorting domain-containing protein [Sedimentisphaerales bacterium]MBN2844249.1 PEP-CTERM sorting domain-containing protein [Sedimentisphaerales bacterium]